LAKRLTNDQKKEIIDSFNQGESIENLSKLYKCTKPTIIRNLKKNFGDKRFKELLNKNKTKKNTSTFNKNQFLGGSNSFDRNIKNINSSKSEFNLDIISQSQFLEIAPLDYKIEDLPQKDLASVPILDVDLPDIVYMIVDKKIELLTKYLKDYPEWQFLSDDELNRKTIEIYFDLKTAKRFCNKEQKVIKVPNTRVFKLVAPILLKKGISRIVSFDKLISL
jgi:hypothetical protein